MKEIKIDDAPQQNPLAQNKSRRQDHVHEVTVYGVYSAAGGEQGKLLSKDYEITFKVLDSQAKEHGALSLFKHVIGPRVLQKQDNRFVGIIEHHIKHTHTPGFDLPTAVKLMSRGQLLQYIEQEDLPVKAYLYEDAGSLQQAVLDAEDDESAFIKNQETLIKNTNKRPGAIVQDDLLDLNAELFADDQADVVVAPGVAQSKGKNDKAKLGDGKSVI